MTSALAKYAACYRAAFSLEVVYRLNFFLGRLRAIVVFLALVWLWTGVYAGRSAGGYDAASIFTYVLLASLVVDLVISQQNQATVADSITTGGLSAYLLKPLSFIWTQFIFVLPAPTLILLTLPFQLALLLVLFPGQTLSLPATFLPWFAFIPSLVLAFAIAFHLDLLTGFIAFWLDRAYGPRWMMTVFVLFGSGAYIPLPLITGWTRTLLSYTPFPSLVYGPVHLLTEQLTTFQIAQTLLVQLFWLASLAIASRFVWRAGLKRYEAAGI